MVYNMHVGIWDYDKDSLYLNALLSHCPVTVEVFITYCAGDGGGGLEGARFSVPRYCHVMFSAVKPHLFPSRDHL